MAKAAVLTPSVRAASMPAAMVLTGTRGAPVSSISDPANTFSEFKRLMGTAQQADVCPRAALVRRAEGNWPPKVLKSLRQDVADQIGVAPGAAPSSRCPPLFRIASDRRDLRKPARLAGFETHRDHPGAGRLGDRRGLER